MFLDSKRVVACNLCGVDDATVLFRPGEAQISQIVKCNRCGLMYVNPRLRPPDEVEIQTWNVSEAGNLDQHADDQSDGAEAALTNILGIQRFEKEKLQVRDYADTRKILNQLYPQRGKLLEIGSALGFLLRSFQDDGWDVLGVDPDRRLSQYAKKQLNVPIACGVLNDANIEDGSFDVVLMMHVIEHVPDPLGHLREIHRVLKPGGHLVMETPRYDSLMFRIFKRRERSLSCDGHIYFYTIDSLKRTYELAGFRGVRLDLVGRSLTLDRLIYNVGVMSKSGAVQKGLGYASRKLQLQKRHLHLNFRDMQRVIVEKRN